MAVQAIIENSTGSRSSPQLPVFVYDDAQATVSKEEAVAVAENLAPQNFFENSQDGDPGFEQLADHAWRITIRYSPAEIFLVISKRRGNHNAVAETLRNQIWAPPVARFPATAPDLQGTLLIGGLRLGADIPPGVESTGVATQMNIVQLTPNLLKLLTLWTRAGVVNSAPIRGYAAGELQLVTFRAQQDTQTTYQVFLGYSGKANVSGLAMGDVSGISHQGHDFVFPFLRKFADRNNATLGQVASAVYVTRPRPQADLRLLPVDLWPDAIS